MIFFSKTEDENPKVPAPATGRLETTYEQLKRDFGDQLFRHIYEIDISDYTKEFTDTLTVPLKIQNAARHVLDDYLKDENECYFPINEKKFGVFLKNASTAVAELKIQVIQNELGRVIEKLKRKSQASGKQNVERLPAAPKTRVAPGAAEKRGTLSDNLEKKELQDWASRALMNMTTQHGYDDFQADIQHMSRMIGVQFKPVWYAPNNLISGYAVETTASFCDLQYEDKQLQEDLALFAASMRHLRAMRDRKEQALLIVPVFLQTICSKTTRDLFNIFCRSLDPELKRFLVLRIKGVNTKSMGRTEWDFLKMAAGHCRSVIFEVPLRRKIDIKSLSQHDFHAFGLDISHIHLPEEHLLRVIENFAQHYQCGRKKTYILGVPSKSLLLAALNSGYAYVSGPAVSPFLKAPKHASHFKLEDLYQVAG